MSCNISICLYPVSHALFSLSLQSSAVEQVLDILMDILSWEIAEMVSPCLPCSLWSEIVIRVFLLLGTVCPRHPPYPVLYPLVHSRGHSPICNSGTRVVAVVPQPSANLSHQQTPPMPRCWDSLSELCLMSYSHKTGHFGDILPSQALDQ